MKKFKYYVLAIVALISVTVFSVARANPTYLPPHSACSTSSATSSVSSISTSTATITLTCDSYALATGLTDPTAMTSAVLAMQYRAPQATTALTVTLQYSEDNVDWYDDNLGTVATTTGPTNIAPAKTYFWLVGTTSTSSKVVDVRTPTRYVRAQFTATAGAATSTIWATFIPRKERAE